MDDYRGKADKSPYVWCVVCHELVETETQTRLMKTVFHVSLAGVYPWGRCARHADYVIDKCRSDISIDALHDEIRS